jgi:hypothetical protein
LTLYEFTEKGIARPSTASRCQTAGFLLHRSGKKNSSLQRLAAEHFGN